MFHTKFLSTGDWMASDVSDIRDLDELEVYGSEAQTSIHIASYTFEVFIFIVITSGNFYLMIIK